MRLIIDLQGAQSSSRNRGIGRYSRSLVEAMASAAGAHDVVLMLNAGFADSAADLRRAFGATLPPQAIRLWQGPGRQSAIDPGNDGRRRAAEQIRASLLQSLDADLLLQCSLFEGFGDDAVTGVPAGVVLPPTVAICYDLIPLLRPDGYLQSPRARAWYFRRLLQMRNAAGLLAISQSGRQEAIDELGIAADRAISIQAGVAQHFRPARQEDEPAEALLARYGLPEGAILCVGAVERRKNLDGLIRAYALLPPKLRRAHRLVATVWNDTGQVQVLRRLATSLGLGSDEVQLLTEFVPERDLPGLYRASTLCVCPSLHEGFGLSAAEAMACGVAVLGSNTTSLPEVIGTPSALFDPTDPADIARRMSAVLAEPRARTELAAAGLARSALFTWPNTARRAWQALEAVAERGAAAGPRRVRPGARLPRLAVFTPLTHGHAVPTALLCGLAALYRIDLVSEDPPPDDPWITASFEVLPLARLATIRFDRVLYYPSNDPRATLLTLQLLDAYPGVVLLGDRPLAAMLGEVLGTAGEAALQNVLVELHGWRAAVALRADATESQHFPVDEAIARRAIGTLTVGPARPHEAGLSRLQRLHALDAVACEAAIEHAYADGDAAGYDACLAALAEAELNPSELAPAAVAAAASFRLRPTGPSLFLDVTTLIGPGGDGAAPMMREIVRAVCQAQLGAATRVEPIRQADGTLLLARQFAATMFGLLFQADADPVAEIGCGDIVVSLNPAARDAEAWRHTMHQVQVAGAHAYLVLHELPAAIVLDSVLDEVEGIICGTRTEADTLIKRFAERPVPLRIGWLELGAAFQPERLREIVIDGDWYSAFQQGEGLRPLTPPEALASGLQT